MVRCYVTITIMLRYLNEISEYHFMLFYIQVYLAPLFYSLHGVAWGFMCDLLTYTVHQSSSYVV